MKSDCAQCRERFSEYLDGALEASGRREVDAHLRGCAQCRAELDLWRSTTRALAELPRRAAPDGFGARVMERLGPPRAAAPLRPRLLTLWARALPVAAMFLLVFGIMFTVHRNGAFDRARAPVRAVAMRVAAPAPMAAAARGLPAVEEAASDEVSAAALGGAGALGTRMAAPESARRGAAVRLGEEERPERMAMSLVVAGAGARAAAEAEPMTDSVRKPAAMAPRPYRSPAEPMLRKEADALVFRQTAAPPDEVRPPEQVLTMQVKDPLETARRAIAAINAQGLQATLALRANNQADIVVQVPADRYDPVVAALAGLTPPQSQMLSNTAFARGDFYRWKLASYNAINSRRPPPRHASAPPPAGAMAAWRTVRPAPNGPGQWR